MLHIYRQIVALPTFHAAVLTRKREETARFPFEDVSLVPTGSLRWLRRIWQKQILGRPITIGSGEAGRLCSALAAVRPSVLHIYFGHVAVQLMPLLRRWHAAPVVVSFHGADVLVDLERPAHRRATLEMLQRADLVLARSLSLLDALRSLGCPETKLRLHRTGIPLAEFPFQLRIFPPTEDRWRLFQACRLIEKKGLFTSLRAFARFVDKHPQATLTLAGDGPLFGALRELASELGVAERVRFPGFLSQADLQHALQESHFFLHPSEMGTDGNQEGVPNSLLEAMSTGLVVIGSHHGGIPEAIEHDRSGWLVHEGNDAELAEGLFLLAGDPARMSAMGEEASRVVREKFEQQAQAAKLESYYLESMEVWERGVDARASS